MNKRKTTKEKQKKKSRKLMKTVVCLLSFAIIFGVSFLGYKIYKNGGGISGILATVLGEDEESLQNLQPLKILVMGISGVDDYKLADTIMIVYYNPKTQAASLMSIPRDTYVGKRDRKTATQNYIASYKINTVFRSGTNIPEAIDRINDLTDLDLENYIIIDTKALQKLVDAIGGVYFNVPIDMDYDDESQNLAIHLKAGEQLIDGQKAEWLLRFRHNNNGTTYPASYGMEDLGRMRTQREFIIATLKQTLKPHNIFKLKQILDIANDDVNTNIDLASLKSYIPFAVDFDTENLKTGVLPGDVEMCNGVSIIVANKNKAKALINELFTERIIEENNDEEIKETEKNESAKKDVNNNVKLQVLNGTSSNSNLVKVIEKLKKAGFTISKEGTTNIVEKTSILNRTNQSKEIITTIENILGNANTSKADELSNVDITIIIGKDYK